VFYYPETHDIVIAGPAEGYVHDLSGRVRGILTGRSVLELEDLVVALRAFPPSGTRTPSIGCSIDPRPEGLANLQALLMQLGGRATPADTQTVVQLLKKALGPQDVSVIGVSDKTHFARVLVEADYRMKLIGIGLEKPPVEITSYVEKANPAAVSQNALQRWYFVPKYDCVRVSDDERAMELEGDGVQLVGADEMVTADGARVVSTQKDRASQTFVASFTRQYAELAKREPVYAQLRNLIDMSIAAAYIQDRDFYGDAGWRMEVFGDEAKFPVEVYEAPKQVETAVNAVWSGKTLMTPIGGGVDVQPRAALQAGRIKKDADGTLDALHKAIDLTVIDTSRWWWD
jgi:acid stress-induced BolA-like protein IbaG/YrbA